MPAAPTLEIDTLGCGVACAWPQANVGSFNRRDLRRQIVVGNIALLQVRPIGALPTKVVRFLRILTLSAANAHVALRCNRPCWAL